MGRRFGAPERQAEKMARGIMRDLSAHIASAGTNRNYRQCLTNVALVLAERGENLREMSVIHALEYLHERALDIGQSALNQERQALEAMFVHVTHRLSENEHLPMVSSAIRRELSSRVYTQAQIALVREHQHQRNALSTELAQSAGLRAHELQTIGRIGEQPPSQRESKDPFKVGRLRFEGRDNPQYTVVGKGGLVREITFPAPLIERLEQRRHPAPVRVRDRRIYYDQRYDIGGGNAWSKSFTQAAQRALGWSEGAHGLRHTYAQERIDELYLSAAVDRRYADELNHGSGKKNSMSLVDRENLRRDLVLRIVSMEMGHFRPSITEVYLR